MSRATEQEAYELLKKLGISFQKSRSSCDYVSQKCPFFPTWSASKKSIIEIKKRKTNLSCHLA